MLFLAPTNFLVSPICALYDNVRASVTPRYTGRWQWVRFTPFQLMLSCLPYSRFRMWKRLTCVFVGFAELVCGVVGTPTVHLELRSVFPRLVKVCALCSDGKIICIHKAARVWINRLVVCVDVKAKMWEISSGTDQ